MKKIVSLTLISFYTTTIQTVQLSSLYDILPTHPNIEYIKCHEALPFYYPQFPLSHHPDLQPNTGIFAQAFIIKIPNGKAFSRYGYIHINRHIIKEFFSQNYPLQWHLTLLSQRYPTEASIKKIAGRVVVITRIDHDCYGHWLAELLTRLLMVHAQDIEYDWIYTPYTHRYIKESLALLGIDPSKIVEPFHATHYIQADELIVPSLPSRQIPSSPSSHFTGYYPATFYCPDWTIALLRDTFLPIIKNQDFAFASKKVFISRNDSHQRRMINEDQIFALFEQKGFKRYRMSNLSFAQQLALFYNADYIVAAHGSALTNLIFCQPHTKVIEIFQNQFDSGFWQLSQQLGLDHTCLKTQDLQPGSWKVDTFVDPKKIQTFINGYNWEQ